MNFIWLVPHIYPLATGGNRFNSRMIQELQKDHTVERVVIPDSVSEKNFYSRVKGDINEGETVILLDSLLLLNDEFISELAELPHQFTLCLIVHYLNCIDPAKAESRESDRERTLLSRFDGFIATSEFTKQMLIRNGIGSEQVVVIRPGLEKKAAFNRKKEITPAQILTVSSIFPGKGLFEILPVLEKLSGLEWNWHLAGENRLDADFSEKFIQRISRSGIKNRFLYHGPQDHEAVLGLYRQSDIFLLPSYFETCSMVTMEAMAAGLPVVAYQTGGIPELVRSEKNGFLIPLVKESEMEERIRTLIENRELRQKFGHESQRISSEFHGWDKANEKMLKFAERFKGKN